MYRAEGTHSPYHSGGASLDVESEVLQILIPISRSPHTSDFLYCRLLCLPGESFATVVAKTAIVSAGTKIMFPQII